MPTIRENVVILKAAEIESVTVIPDSAVVSVGQPSDGAPRINHHMDVISVLFKAGRHKTREVAEKFNDVTGGKGHEYAPQGGSGGTPRELNFFFGIRVKWKSGGETVLYLGQGSNGPRNNWWIGAPQIEAGDSARITLPSGQVLKIEGASPEEDLGAPFDILDKFVPDQFKGLADLIGKPLLKELFGQVNLFRFST